VVQFDDLDGLEERGRLLCEVHHQDRADAEVGRDQHVGAGLVRLPASDRLQPGGLETRGADDGVDAVGDQELEVVHDHDRVGEVDHHVGCGQHVHGVALIHRGDQFEICGAFDGLADLSTHAPTRAQYADLDHDHPPDIRLTSLSRHRNMRYFHERILAQRAPAARPCRTLGFPVFIKGLRPWRLLAVMGRGCPQRVLS
jgi:hypothetical protein